MPRLPKPLRDVTRRAWKRLLQASPADQWRIIPPWVQRSQAKAMARAGLVRLSPSEYCYILTGYGRWCRDRWIDLDVCRHLGKKKKNPSTLAS